mgnify:CR=1 FL=1
MEKTADDWLELHGKPIKMFYFGNQSPDVCPYVTPDTGGKMYLHVEYLGDRTEAWVINKTASGRERARYNARTLEAIIWVDETEPKF